MKYWKCLRNILDAEKNRQNTVVEHKRSQDQLQIKYLWQSSDNYQTCYSVVITTRFIFLYLKILFSICSKLKLYPGKFVPRPL